MIDFLPIEAHNALDFSEHHEEEMKTKNRKSHNALGELIRDK